jgi:hypothetical protein
MLPLAPSRCAEHEKTTAPLFADARTMAEGQLVLSEKKVTGISSSPLTE